MKDETEVIFHRDINDDETAKVRHHDNKGFWMVESYDKRVSRIMEQVGAIEKRSLHDGRVFVVDARQLIEFIAASSGLIVEFRTRRRQQLTPEQMEAKRLRMSALNASQRAKV